MRVFRFAVLLALSMLFIAGAARADLPWHVTRTRHFIIYYTRGGESLAASAGEMAERWNAAIAQKLGSEPEGVTPIYLYPDRRAFAEATGVRPNEAVVGTAHTRTLRIDIDASGAFTEIEHIIPHELVHALIFRKLRIYIMRLPLWMNEGLAKYLADDWSSADAETLSDAAVSGEIMPLDSLFRSFPREERGRAVAYAQSCSAVKFMAERWGEGSIPDLLDGLAAGKTFDEAVFESLGVTPERFEEEWRADLWERYGFSRWARIGSGVLSALMALAAALAFRARRIQQRRKALEYEEEESAQLAPAHESPREKRRLAIHRYFNSRAKRRRRSRRTDEGEP